MALWRKVEILSFLCSLIFPFSLQMGSMRSSFTKNGLLIINEQNTWARLSLRGAFTGKLVLQACCYLLT